MRKIFFIAIILISLIAMGISGYVFFTNNSSKMITISFNTNSDIILDNMRIKEGSSIKLPKIERNDYNLIGWYLGDEKIDNNYKFYKNTILNARWEEKTDTKKKHTVKFVIPCCDGCKCSDTSITKEVEDGKTVEKPADPKMDGYKFKEWQLNGKAYDFKKPVTSDLTLTAVWGSNSNKKTYTVTFQIVPPNGCSEKGTVTTKLVEEGKTVAKPSNPSMCGAKFKEWRLNGTAYSFSKAVTKDITLISVWESSSSNTNKTHKVVFDLGYKSCNYANKCVEMIYAEADIEDGMKIIRPADPTRNGYRFKGWYVNGNDFDFETRITSDITITADWTPGSETKSEYTVIFNSNGGTSVAKQIVKAGEKAKRPSDPIRPTGNYIFDDWYLNNTPYDFTKPVNSDITLIAGWTDCNLNTSAGSKTVKFNTNGGNKINNMNICTTCASTQVTLPVPTKSGYAFDGWFADSALTRKVSGKANDVEGADWTRTGCVTYETTIYARWIDAGLKIYTITLINEQGTQMSTPLNLKFACGTKISALPTLSDTSTSTFVGWFDKTNNKQYKNGDTMPCSDLSLYARWQTK